MDVITISCFENFNQVSEQIDLTQMVERIKNGRYRSPIEKLRILYHSGSNEAFTAGKKSLPAFTPSAQYQGGRKAEYLTGYNRIVILDLDKLEQVAPVRAKIEQCPYTLSCFLSPSGNGLKILVKTDNSAAKHKEAFLAVQAHYEHLTGVKIDPSGKDLSRLCFVSYDPDIFYHSNAKIFNLKPDIQMKNDLNQLMEQIEGRRLDLTSNYEDWLKIGFALESELGEAGRSYFHQISRFNPHYSPEICNEQYNKCLRSPNSGISIKTLFYLAKQNGIIIRASEKHTNQNKPTSKSPTAKEQAKVTTNKFVIAEEYLNKHFDLRYNVVSNKFEYKKKHLTEWEEMNENNMFVQLQKDNVTICLNHLISLLKSDFVEKYNVFQEYFENLPEWDGQTDYILKLSSFLITRDRERLDRHFKKWLVRAVRTAIDDHYFNKQAFVLVSTKQNSGKSTFMRFLCPPALKDYIAESIATDKDSLIAITENFLINLDELSQAEKAEINAFKSMFSKEKIKARLTYDKRPTVHSRRASFMGSTDRWEFLTDENGSVRWLCFEIDQINWEYKTEIDIDRVWSQAYHLLTKVRFEYELSTNEIKENEAVNKKYQVSSPERDLLLKYFSVGNTQTGEFMTSTEILEYLSAHTSIKLSPIQIGKELRFIGYERVSKFFLGNMRYGYFIKKNELFT